MHPHFPAPGKPANYKLIQYNVQISHAAQCDPSQNRAAPLHASCQTSQHISEQMIANTLVYLTEHASRSYNIITCSPGTQCTPSQTRAASCMPPGLSGCPHEQQTAGVCWVATGNNGHAGFFMAAVLTLSHAALIKQYTPPN